MCIYYIIGNSYHIILYMVIISVVRTQHLHTVCTDPFITNMHCFNKTLVIR